MERVLFYHCDQVGTPQTLSNELGECIWEIKQDVWGEALEIKASHNLLEQTNIRFQGQYYDSETGLHYNRYRYYEPYSARYVSKDPVGLEGGLNNLAYVSDPNMWVDPLGLMAEKNKDDHWRIPDNASKWLIDENKYHKDIYDATQQKKNANKASQIKYAMDKQKNLMKKKLKIKP